MSGNKVTQQLVVQSQATVNPNLFQVDTAFFTPSGQNVQPGVIAMTTSEAATALAYTTTSVEPPAGSTIALKFTNGHNTTAGAPTVAFNGGTARTIYCAGAATTLAKFTLAANGIALLYFDGTNLHQYGHNI